MRCNGVVVGHVSEVSIFSCELININNEEKALDFTLFQRNLHFRWCFHDPKLLIELMRLNRFLPLHNIQIDCRLEKCNIRTCFIDVVFLHASELK